MKLLTVFLTLVNKQFDSTASQPAAACLLATVLAFFAPLWVYVYFLALLLLADAATSVIFQAKHRINRIKGMKFTGWEKTVIGFRTFESAKFRITLFKLGAYVFLLLLFYIFDILVTKVEPFPKDSFNYLSVTSIAVLLMCSTELTSITANLGKITNNPLYARISKFFNKSVNDKLNDNET